MTEAAALDWTPEGELPASLMLASTPTLSVDDGAVPVPAKSPFRVVQTDGGVLLIEVKLPDGALISGYTTRERTASRRNKRRWFR